MYKILILLLLSIFVNADSFTDDSYQNVKIGMSGKEASSILNRVHIQCSR